MGKSKQRSNEFAWAVFGISAGSFLTLLIATWLIVRITDGNWLSWQLPSILGIVFIVVVCIAAMFFALPEIKKEIEKEKEKQ